MFKDISVWEPFKNRLLKIKEDMKKGINMLQQKPQETATEIARTLPQITRTTELISPLQVLHDLANRIARYTTEGTYRTVGGAEFGANFARNTQRYIQEGTVTISSRLDKVLSLAGLEQQPKTTEQKKQNV